MRCFFIHIISISFFLSFFVSCLKEENAHPLAVLQEEIVPTVNIRQGYVSQERDTLEVLRGDSCLAQIVLSDPKVVAQAKEEESWGFFQFPSICRAENGNLLVSWSMKPDSHTAYGDRSSGRRMSKDEGLTWEYWDREYFLKERYGVEMKNGMVLQLDNPASKDITSYDSFPAPVNEKPRGGLFFFFESDLPDDLRGVYFNLWDRSSNTLTPIHATIEDPQMLRYAYAADNLMPIVWWGPLKEQDDNTLIAGVYGSHYLNPKGNVLKTGISFYSSTDYGYSWKILGKIPYKTDEYGYEGYLYDGEEGFSEPAFEVMNDGKGLVCVMRSGLFKPMYRSFSCDGGASWSDPEPFAWNGVKPTMLKLGNGVLVLSSGRPGVQLRFCIDGDGKVWTEPIEMMPFMDDNNQFKDRVAEWVSCGYTSIIQADVNSFYIVYSDFYTKNSNGDLRKSILFRKVQVFKRP